MPATLIRDHGNFDSLKVSSDTDGVEASLTRLRTTLYACQLPQGGWPFINQSSQMALEPTCLALLALRSTNPIRTQVLADSQRPDGSWGSFAGDDQSSGLTGLALLTLSTLAIGHQARRRA
ncbi:MAG: hypothetical protein ACRD2G_03685, partial [Terriglobia bacterium]